MGEFCTKMWDPYAARTIHPGSALVIHHKGESRSQPPKLGHPKKARFQQVLAGCGIHSLRIHR